MADITADLILLFSTPSEKEAIRQAARARGLPFTAVGGKFAEYFPLGSVGADRVTAVRCEMGPLGHGGSASTALFAKIETQAVAIATVGMCFGVRDGEQAFRDVVVSTALVPYDRRNVGVDPTGTLPYIVDYSTASWVPASRPLVARMRRALSGASFQFAVHFGALLSGGARIHSTVFRDELVKLVPPGDDPVVGGEMEGVGLIATSPPDDPNWIIVKGISDFGNNAGGSYVKEHRKQACQNAVDYLFHALSTPVEG